MPLLNFLLTATGKKEEEKNSVVIGGKRRERSSFVLTIEGVTNIKVVPGMLQDELSGVGFVLTVTHIHLELISLEEKEEEKHVAI